MAALSERPLRPDFEFFERFEKLFFTYHEILSGYVQAMPQGERQSLARSIATFKIAGVMRSIDDEYSGLTHILLYRALLGFDKMLQFWDRFPSLRRIAKGEYEH